MKSCLVMMLTGGLLLAGAPAFSRGEAPGGREAGSAGEVNNGGNAMKDRRMKIRIGAKVFAATLADNPAASAFKALLPLNLRMSDLHGNEKFFHLPSRLPAHDANPGMVQAGDLMLWSSTSVVLFYKSFRTSYRYTKLGRIDDPKGLAAAVGAGEVTVRFELEQVSACWERVRQGGIDSAPSG